MASLQTRAVRDGDDFVVNGQKIWTSGGHRADWIFLLARTDPDAPKHRGITYFTVDMSSPGVSPFGRWSTWPAPTSSTKSSSKTSAFRARTSSARRTAAGTWPRPRSASSAPTSVAPSARARPSRTSSISARSTAPMARASSPATPA
ncbi:MAG: acyl-CoA dehydrogenase family protein [Dehalococcoidia bacterium]|nr:acyl-CoA dehydrogenase family protein [Dehalococcoidia bacterium]